MINKNKKCPHCGAAMRIYDHRINKSLVSALSNLLHCPGYQANITKIGLTHNQIANFQKLRYWDLVRSKNKSGVWVLTYKGVEFLNGRIGITEKVTTYRGRAIGFPKDVKTIYIGSNYEIHYQKRLDYLKD